MQCSPMQQLGWHGMYPFFKVSALHKPFLKWPVENNLCQSSNDWYIGMLDLGEVRDVRCLVTAP